jgi:nucleoside-diphosphate-sugar epimerase
MKKVIITGVSGFIGGALARRLLREGVTVYGVARDERKLAGLKDERNFVPIIASFEQYHRLHELITDDAVDVFYHFAWQGVIGEAFKDYALQLSNARYACDAVYEAQKIGCKKFVMAGTSNEYEILNYFENSNSELRYTRIYSACKLSAEVICKTIAINNGIGFNCGLIAMSFGEGNYSPIVPNVVLAMLNKNEPPKLIAGNSLYDLVYIADIVDAFIAIGERGFNNKSYYIGHRKLRTFREIFTDIGAFVNSSIALKFGEYPEANAIDYSKIDLDALYNDTGFECKADFKESVLKTALWLKSLN